MQLGSKFIYYFILIPMSHLPMTLLYLFSSFFKYLLFYLIPYRKKVVMGNLNRCFPEKSKREINTIGLAFYGHLCDLIVESIKLFTISEKEIRERFVFNNAEILDEFYKSGQSIVLVGGHYNNWEMLAVSCALHMKHLAIGIYNPLNNVFFNEKFTQSRTKYGLKMITTKDTFRFFASKHEIPYSVFFGSDQSPTYSKNVFWTDFLGQDTAVAAGVEVLAKKYNHPVIYGKINKVKRGYFTFDLEVLFESPKDIEEVGLITKTFTHKIEAQILEKPEYWLWSHKRWKRKRSEDEKI